MMIEIKFKAPLYGKVDRNGNQKIVKRSVLYTELVDLDNIKSVGMVFKKDGTVEKRKCRINHENLGTLIVEHPYEYIRAMKQDRRVVVKGFRG